LSLFSLKSNRTKIKSQVPLYFLLVSSAKGKKS